MTPGALGSRLWKSKEEEEKQGKVVTEGMIGGFLGPTVSDYMREGWGTVKA